MNDFDGAGLQECNHGDEIPVRGYQHSNIVLIASSHADQVRRDPGVYPLLLSTEHIATTSWAIPDFIVTRRACGTTTFPPPFNGGDVNARDATGEITVPMLLRPPCFAVRAVRPVHTHTLEIQPCCRIQRSPSTDLKVEGQFGTRLLSSP